MDPASRRKRDLSKPDQQQDDHHDRGTNILYLALHRWLDGLVAEEEILRKTGSALDKLARDSMQGVDKSIIDGYLDDMRDDARFLRREYYLGHKDDHPPWAFNDDSSSVDMQNFAIMVKKLAKSPDQTLPWGRIDRLFRLLFSLQKFQRFADIKNPTIEDSPLPNGSNLVDPDLRAAFNLHQFWMSLLHDRSLFSKGLDTGLLQLGKILIITRVQQEREASRTRNSETQLLAGFDDIKNTITRVRALLENLAEQFGDYCRLPEAARRFKKPINLRETAYEIDSEEVQRAWAKLTGRMDRAALFTLALWSRLLDFAEVHNHELDQTYVEDLLWPKDLSDEAEQLAMQIATKISQVNRERRNYLTLCDWSKTRPWKQIYCIFDTRAIVPLQNPIDSFYNKIAFLSGVNFHPVEKNSPCHPGNIFQGIFPIHPIPNHRPFLGHGSYTGSCVVCGHNYQIREDLARLHCDHYFHFSCIRKYWDNAEGLSYACPSCKKPSPQPDKAIKIEKGLSNPAANVNRASEAAAKRDSARTGPPDQPIERSTNMARTRVLSATRLQGKVNDNQSVQGRSREEELAAPPRPKSSTLDRNVDKPGAGKTSTERRNESGGERVSTKKRARNDDGVLPDTKKAKVDLSLNPPPMERLDVYVCGTGESGELGLGAKPFGGKKPLGVQRPRYNHLLKGVTQIGVGGMHCIVLTDDQKILTWGVNDDGALARNTTTDADADSDSDSESEEDETGLSPLESTPTALSTAFLETKRVAQVVASDSASFVLTDDGMVYGWGTFRGNEGLIGFTTQGAAQAAGIKDDASKKEHQIQLEPILIPGLKNITSLARGGNHVLALDSKGNVFSWGSWQQCQIGRRPPVRAPFSGLTPAPFMKKIKYIAAGTYHSFAIDTRDRVWAWGLNNFGQTGIASNAGQDGAIINTPTQVKSLNSYKIKQIKGGVHHTIACTEDGQVLIWGRCDEDQAGIDLSTLPQDDLIFSKEKPGILTKPTVVPGISATFVAAGIDNSMVVTEEGTVYAWGFSENYRTGLGTVENVTRPTLVENSAVKGKRMTFVGCGGQFSVLAGPENR